jgi:hypothetical protein
LISPRRFPRPWTIEEMNNACFIVRDKGGSTLPHSDEAVREIEP